MSNDLFRVVVGFLCTLCCLSTTQASDERLNIVVILADALGFADIACYGSEIETPNIDRLAANGVNSVLR